MAAVATPRLQGGLVTGMSSLTTSAATIWAHRRVAADSLTIRLAQPLRVEGGQAALRLPVARTQQGKVLHSPLQVGLTPSGREVAVTMRWQRHLAAGGDALAEVAWTRDPGHDARAGVAWRVLAGWRKRF